MKKPKRETHPAYPRGFVYDLHGKECPAGFIGCAALPGLFHDPALPVEISAEGDVTVAVLGTCVRSDRRGEERAAVHDLLDAFRSGGAAGFFEAIDPLCGRFVALLKGAGTTTVTGDATGMRAVYYVEDQPVVASHGALANARRTKPAPRKDFPSFNGYPGSATPWKGVRLLMPNLALEMPAMRLFRVFPLAPLTPYRTAAGTARISQYAANALHNFAARYTKKFLLGMTAGLDSRTTLALLQREGIEFTAMTWDIGGESTQDCEMARQLAAKFRFPHRVVAVDRSRATSPNRSCYNNAAHLPRTFRLVDTLSGHYGDDTVFLSSNGLEIGRLFYRKFNVDKTTALTPEGAAELFLRLALWKVKAQVDAFPGGQDAYVRVVEAEMGRWQEQSGFVEAARFVRPNSLFYWEHRMGAWHSQMCLLRDFALDTFIPFNSRAVFATMLGAPLAKQESGALQWEIIRGVSMDLARARFAPTEQDLAPLP